VHITIPDGREAFGKSWQQRIHTGGADATFDECGFCSFSGTMVQKGGTSVSLDLRRVNDLHRITFRMGDQTEKEKVLYQVL